MPTGNGNVKRTRSKGSVEVHLPLAALSTNKMYSGRKHRSVYYKSFRKQVLKELKKVRGRSSVNLTGNLGFSLEVGFSSPMSDLSNALKAIEDILAFFFDFNDRQIVHHELDKYLVNKGDEYMKIRIYKVRKNIDKRSKGGE